MNECLLTIVMSFVAIDEKSMKVEIIHNGNKEVFQPNATQRCTFEKLITLPSSVELTFSDKNLNTDTLIDNDGRITLDKSVKIN